MHITYTHDAKKCLVFVESTGVLTTAEVLEYFDRLTSDVNCPKDAIEVVDLSAVDDLVIRYSQTRTITQTFAHLKTRKRLLATVFLCKSDMAYGTARMMQSLFSMTDPPHEMQIARSNEELRTTIEDIRSDKADADDGK